MKVRRHRNANRFMLTWVFYGFLVYPFAGLAAVGVGFITMMALNMMQMRSAFNSTVELFIGAAFGGAIGWAVGMLQTRALRDQLRWSADNWVKFSVIGGVIGGLLVIALVGLGRNNYFYELEVHRIRFMMVLFMGTISVFQWWALREAVGNASLWIAANLAAAFVFGSITGHIADSQNTFYNRDGWDEIIALATILFAPFMQAFITGTVMLTLFERFAYPVERYGKRNIVVPKKSPSEASIWDEAV